MITNFFGIKDYINRQELIQDFVISGGSTII